jgi:hypothetical protein
MTDPEAAGPDHAGGKSEEALEASPVAYNESEQVSPGQAAPLDSAVGGLTVLPDVDEPPPGTLPPPAAQCPAAPSSAAMGLSPAKRRRDDQIRIRESRTGVSAPAAAGALELPSAAAHAACLGGVALGCGPGRHQPEVDRRPLLTTTATAPATGASGGSRR